MINPQPQQVQQQQQERGGFSWWTIIMVFLGVNLFTGMLGRMRESQPAASTGKRPPSIGMLVNAIKPLDQLDVLVRVTNATHTLFEARQLMMYSLESPPINLEFELTDLQNLEQNLTITALAKVVGVKVDAQPIGLHFTANFTAYKRLRDDQSEHYHSQLGTSSSKNKTTTIPTDFNVLIVYSETPYPSANLPIMYDFRPLPTSTGLYFLPPIDLNQIHIGSRHYRRLPNATQNHTVKLHIFCYSEYKYMLFAQFGKKPKLVDPRLEGFMDLLQDADAMDEMKQVLFDNNLYLVGLTLILSVLESVFQLLAVKNEIHFWKNIEQHPGISIRSLTTQLLFTVVIVLYLVDSGASKLVIIMQLINVPVCIWKLGKATKVERQQQFPYFKLTNYSWYRPEIQQYDNQGTRYLYYVLAPVFLCYLGWKIYSKGGATNWYSFVLESLVGFIMIFGFVAMTPQLFLNYKLKSVAHLPWRMLIYRFLSTIMDDLYSFLVTMPWLWRLGCFRDDVIFIVYLYQRCIYRTDHNRTDLHAPTVAQPNQQQPFPVTHEKTT